MSRKPTINWRKGDTEKFIKEVERFNAKIYRVRNRHPELSDILPETIKRDEVQKMIHDFQNSPRSEFKKELKSLQRFSKRGAENVIESKTGNRVTRWEKNEVGIKVAQINRERTRERKAYENMEATSRGEEIGLKRGEMGSERLKSLQPKKFNFDKIKGGKEWEKFKESIDKQSSVTAKQERMDNFKNNYIKGLENAFGDYAKEIIDIIKNIPSEKVVDTFYSEQEATIDFFYEPQEMSFKVDILKEIWQGISEDIDEVHG